MSYGTLQIEKMTTESGYSLGAGNASSFKNRIINGAMVINQRAPGATVTLNTSQDLQLLDRFRFAGGFAGYTNTVQQSSIAPAGFSTSLLWTNTASAGAIGSGVYNTFFQNIEGYNTADLAWGTADAKPITLSFWVRSSVIGTYGVTFTNGTNYYVGTYTVNAANTWEYKTITVPGATSGTWSTTNTSSIQVKWDMGAGTTYSASAGSWGSGNIWGLTGGVKFVETLNATFYITGVQLEVGTVATSFDFRSYGTELALCQRYCPAWTANATAERGNLIGQAFTTTDSLVPITFPVTARVPPTGISTTGAFSLYNASLSGSSASLVFNNANIGGGSFVASVASGLVAGNATLFQANGASAASRIIFTGCEL